MQQSFKGDLGQMIDMAGDIQAWLGCMAGSAAVDCTWDTWAAQAV
jgi:hypothetical protein